MQVVIKSIRSFAKWRFKALGLASVLDISEKDFERIARHLKDNGWRLTSRYRGFDAGIDYDCLRFRKRWSRLKCEWDNWSDWSIEGSARTVSEIANALGLEVKSEWRWAKWDAPEEKQ